MSGPAAARGTGLLAGAGALFTALRLLRARRELWLWCALPAALNVAVFAGAIAAFLAWGWEPVEAWLRGWLEVAAPSAWYGWIWVAPLRALSWLVRWLVLAVVAAAVYLSFTLVGGVLAAPFLDALSRRVERLQRGCLEDRQLPGLAAALRGTGRAVLEEGKRTAFFLCVELAILLVGLVPGLQLPAVAAAVGFAALFLPLDYTGYALDRRLVPFRARRRWVWQHRRAMMGFGGLALVSFLVPGLNFLCLPWLVTAGTILALELGPPTRHPPPAPLRADA